ncbi:MAG TPA: hypothetical protein VEZ48_08695 [Sphingomonadaceae bacterium]|nr:hypothetical protein [Sphingomonadaceae bacterium]
MALYFFHLCNGTDLLLDPEGRAVDGLAAVQAAALRDARSIISDDASSGRIRLEYRIEVQDAAGVLVHKIAFEDAVTITR